MAFVDIREALHNEAELEAGHCGHDDLERELGFVEAVITEGLPEVVLEDRSESSVNLCQTRPENRHVPAHCQELEEDLREP